MWPFSEMSLLTATLIGTIANWALLASLVVGVLSTFVIVKTADVKEKYWAEDRRQSSEKIAALTTQGDQLRKDTAEANARALEAQLALERLKAPRSLSPDQQRQISEMLKPFAGTQFAGQVAGSVLDARSLWTILDKVLRDANWARVPPWGASAGDPPAGIPVAPNEGVTVFVPQADVPILAPAVNALTGALNAAGIVAVAVPEDGPQSRPKIIVIEIGTKPQ